MLKSLKLLLVTIMQSLNILSFKKLLQFAGTIIVIICLFLIFLGVAKIDSYFEQKCTEYISSKSMSLKHNENEVNLQLSEHIKNDLTPIF